MRSRTAGDEAEAESPPEGLPISRVAVLGLAALGLLVAAALLDLGYYPPRGVLSGGAPLATASAGELPRTRAVVKIVPAMAPRPGARPSLADAARFFGLEEDVLRCSAFATAGEEELDERRVRTLEREPHAVGDSVTLCLD